MKKNPSVLEFAVVSFTNLLLGMGLGVIMASCMTAQLERHYQTTMIEMGVIAGGVLALIVGDLAYYAILRRRVSYYGASVIVTAVGMTGAASAYLLHVTTNTGGWLSVFVAVAVFFASSFKLKTEDT